MLLTLIFYLQTLILVRERIYLLKYTPERCRGIPSRMLKKKKVSFCRNIIYYIGSKYFGMLNNIIVYALHFYEAASVPLNI